MKHLDYLFMAPVAPLIVNMGDYKYSFDLSSSFVFMCYSLRSNTFVYCVMNGYFRTIL